MKSSTLWFSLMFLIALVLQATVVDFMTIMTWKPDLVLILIVIYAAKFGRGPGCTAGFLVGVLSDIMSGPIMSDPEAVIGLGALAKTVTGYFAGAISRVAQEPSQFIFVLFLSGLVHDILFFSVYTLGKDNNWWVLLKGHILGSFLLTTIIGVVVFLAIERRIDQMVEDQQ